MSVTLFTASALTVPVIARYAHTSRIISVTINKLYEIFYHASLLIAPIQQLMPGVHSAKLVQQSDNLPLCIARRQLLVYIEIGK